MQMKKKDKDPGQWLGWLVFLLVIGGAPLLNVFQQATGIVLPSYALPALIGLAVVLNMLVPLLRMAKGRTAGDVRLPNGSEPAERPAMPAITVLPRFGEQPFGEPYVLSNTTAMDTAQSQALPGRRTMSSTQAQALPSKMQALPAKMSVPPIQSPRFDPVISPQAVTVSVIGLMVVIGLALFMFG